jgi:O-antigen/teichoic acid export membrane protein
MQDTPNNRSEIYNVHSERNHFWTAAALNRFISGTGIALFGRVIGRILFVLMQIFFARYLGSEKFGLYAIGWTMLQMLSTIAPLGLDKGIIRYATQYWKSNPANLKGVILQSSGVSLLSGFGLGLLLYLSADGIAEQVFKNSEMKSVIRGFAPALIFLTTIKVTSATTRVTHRMQYAVILEDLLPAIISLILFVPLFLLDYGLSAAINSAVFSYLVSFLLGIITIKRLFPEVFMRNLRSTSSLRALMEYSIPSWLASSFMLFIVWINRLIVGVFQPESEVGIYQASSQISLLFTLITSAIAYVLSPMIADLFNRKKILEVQELFKTSTKWGLYLCLPLFVIAVALPQEILEILYGAEYRSGGITLVILSIGQMVTIATGAVGWMLMMTGNQNRWFWNTTSMLLLSIVANIYLTPRLGIEGAAIATAIGSGMLFILGLIQIRRIFGFWPYDKRYIKIALSTFLTAGIVFSIRQIGVSHTIARLLIISPLAIFSFAFLLYIFGLDQEDKEILRIIMKRDLQTE